MCTQNCSLSTILDMLQTVGLTRQFPDPSEDLENAMNSQSIKGRN
jgi:hypothetical protein